MVLLTIKIRPQKGYLSPNTIQEVRVDSSTRLEFILPSFKLEKNEAFLYSHAGLELPLNSSLASHNIQDGDVLETCSSPVLCAVLKAVAADMEAVQKIKPEMDRTRQRIESLLDYPNFADDDDWQTSRWSFDSGKN
jgi:hypothetical protein